MNLSWIFIKFCLPSPFSVPSSLNVKFITANKRTEEAPAWDQDGETGTRFIRPETTSWTTCMFPDVGLWQHRTAIPYEGETNEVSAARPSQCGEGEPRAYRTGCSRAAEGPLNTSAKYGPSGVCEGSRATERNSQWLTDGLGKWKLPPARTKPHTAASSSSSPQSRGRLTVGHS